MTCYKLRSCHNLNFIQLSDLICLIILGIAGNSDFYIIFILRSNFF